MQDIRVIFEDMVKQHQTGLYCYVFNMVRDSMLAQDIVQETFLKAYENYEGYRETGKIKSWLYTIARNIAYKNFSKGKSDQILWLDAPVHADDNENICIGDVLTDNKYNVENDAVIKEIYEKIINAINNLPLYQRQVVYYRFVEEQSINDTAYLLGLSPGSVKSKTHYGIEKIKSQLKNYFINGGWIMECVKAYEFLYQYAKNKILRNDREELEKHLSVCKECRDIEESLKILIPHIKPAGDGQRRHYKISFQVSDNKILSYVGIANEIENYELLNEVLEKRDGYIPEDETWLTIGSNDKCNFIAEFDNEGNHIEFEIYKDSNSPGYIRKKYKRMKKVFPVHEQNIVSLNPDFYNIYTKSKDAPSLYNINESNNFGPIVRTGIYVALPGKAVNIRIRRGNDIIDTGAYKFVYADRYTGEHEKIALECTYNL